MDDADDDRLIEHLRVIETAGLSERSRELASAAFDWRTMDAELAELVADSALEPMGAVRAHGQPRLVSFEGAGLMIELEIEQRGQARRITGQLLPRQAAAIDIVRPDGRTTTVQAEAEGRFVTELAGGGPVSFRVMSLETDWLLT
jgi:hypothetical protein